MFFLIVKKLVLKLFRLLFDITVLITLVTLILVVSPLIAEYFHKIYGVQYIKSNDQHIKEIVNEYSNKIEKSILSNEKPIIDKLEIVNKDQYINYSLKNGGILITSADNDMLIYLYPSFTQNKSKFEWHCIGVPSNKLPKYCTNLKNNKII